MMNHIHQNNIINFAPIKYLVHFMIVNQLVLIIAQSAKLDINVKLNL